MLLFYPQLGVKIFFTCGTFYLCYRYMSFNRHFRFLFLSISLSLFHTCITLGLTVANKTGQAGFIHNHIHKLHHYVLFISWTYQHMTSVYGLNWRILIWRCGNTKCFWKFHVSNPWPMGSRHVVSRPLHLFWS